MEIVKISIFESVTKTGYVTINLNGTSYNVNVTSGDTSWNVTTKIAAKVFTGYTTSASQNIVTLTASAIGYKEDCFVIPYDTGVAMVAATETNGEDNDNVLSEIKKAPKNSSFKSGRYRKPKKPVVYFCEPIN